MKGKVLTFDAETGQGLISGEDGGRYQLNAADLTGPIQSLSQGTSVDFVAEGDRARQVVAVVSSGVGEKNRIVAALLAIFLGALGIHKFYLGKNGAGVIMLLCTIPGAFLVVPFVAVSIIALIEFVIYLTKTDEQFYEDYVAGEKAWF